jgi:hypothetical protein
MAENPIPLSEMIKINDQNVSDVDGISDLLQDAPFLAAMYAQPASNGTQHKYLKETRAPVVGFRAANDGIEHDSSEDTLVTIALAILDASHHHDQELVNQYKFGPDAFMAREGNRHLQAGFFVTEQQLFYGQAAGAANGFTGLADATTIDALADEMVVNGGGSTALSSVFLVRSVPADTDFTVIMGNDGNITMGNVYQQMMSGSVTGLFNALVQPIAAYLGAQIGSIYSVGRICNLDDGSNSLDDALISDAIAKFPAGRQPTHLAMNRRSRQQLQASRTATTTTGAPAPFPMESFGVPIVTTDGIINDETALA